MPATVTVPAATVAPSAGTSMRDAILIGPSLDHPRGTQKPSNPSQVVRVTLRSHFVADT